MDFNFKEKFKNYSNIELLKIIKQADKFQPEAVEIATTILQERTILEEDVQESDAYFESIEHKAKQKTAIINGYKDKANDLFEPIIRPSEDLKPEKWLHIFLIFLCIQYAWTIYNSISDLISFYNCPDCTLDVLLIISYASFFYVPVILYLLFKRRTWGWILIFTESIFIFVLWFANIYMYFKFGAFYGATVSTLWSILFSLIIRAGFLIFLWRLPITKLFGVSNKTKKDTLFYATVFAIACLIVILFH